MKTKDKIKLIKDLSMTLTSYPICEQAMFNYQMDELYSLIEKMSHENSVKTNFAPIAAKFEEVVSKWFNTALKIELENDKFIFYNCLKKVIDLEYCLTIPLNSPLEALQQIGPMLLGIEVTPSTFNLPSLPVGKIDEGLSTTHEYYCALSSKLAKEMSAHGQLATVNSLVNQNKINITNWYDTVEISESDIFFTALFLIYMQLPITTVRLKKNDARSISKLVLRYIDKEIDVVSMYNEFRASGECVFGATHYTISKLNEVFINEILES